MRGGFLDARLQKRRMGGGQHAHGIDWQFANADWQGNHAAWLKHPKQVRQSFNRIGMAVRIGRAKKITRDIHQIIETLCPEWMRIRNLNARVPLQGG